MKNFSAKIILVFMALILARGAFAAGQDVTIKDGETGMTVELYAIPNEEELFFYGNQRFGYNVSVPYKYFTEVVLLPENEDGMILESKDGTGRFRVTGGYLLDEGELVESYAGRTRAPSKPSEAKITPVSPISEMIIGNSAGGREKPSTGASS